MKYLLSLLVSCFIYESIVAQVQPEQLKVEHLENPIGIDETKPRFSWKLNDGRQGAAQTSYQLVVGTSKQAVEKGSGNMWQTEKIKSIENLSTYSGNPLQPFTQYYWKVLVWDEKDRLGKSSAIASFETGVMGSSWRGAWINDNLDETVKPAPYFRKDFKAKGTVKEARVYITAAGLFELSVNGERIGDQRLDPVYTRYDRRNTYLTFDVTDKILASNTIGVLLGNGWYNHQSTAVWDFHKAYWRGRPSFCLDLRITYTNGSKEVIGTGTDWKTSLGPVIFNSIYTAEHYDARLEQPGWDQTGFIDTSWSPATIKPAPSPNIVAQAMHPIKDNQTFNAKLLKQVNDTSYLFDVGQNISGVSQVTVKGKAGTIVRIKHAELLDKNGQLNLSNIDYHYRPTDNTDPFQTDIFILKGSDIESFRARFNYKGFRYIEISSDQPVKLEEGAVKAYFMHSAVPAVGTISSSNQTLNKIWKATNNSYLSNLFGYPTDCPQREKNGWTGDAHIAIETGLYNFDGITIYEKWLADHRDEQQPNGVLPAIIPTAGWGYSWANGPDWTSTIAIIPWQVYLFYGDEKILKDNYRAIKKYVDYITTISPQYLTTWGLGDWVPVKTTSVVELTSSIYYYTDVKILSDIAHVLKQQDDYQFYKELSQKIKSAINKKYLDYGTGIYANGTQTELSAPLYWNVVPDDMKARVAAQLAKRVKADQYKLDVGLLGSKTILNALSENGYANEAYQMASSETFPSWGWWISNGATTLFENWDPQSVKDNSQNHIMFGEIGAWYYKALAGIRPDPRAPGFKNILLAPHFVKGLDHFEASFNSVRGIVRSSWERKKNIIVCKVEVPAGCSASFKVPEGFMLVGPEAIGAIADQSLIRLDAGSYSFRIKPLR